LISVREQIRLTQTKIFRLVGKEITKSVGWQLIRNTSLGNQIYREIQSQILEFLIDQDVIPWAL
jgi:hypothetical protein